ncbi:cytochrome c [Wenxinia saemankumensis]|uniref:Cytochrome c, mono-and diheme variants n=1 Tax=Wenxinia saemankumensis TaxID=1447782 RepID=A0A1M6A7L5_9RHOB|nr:cytochrome c [Wenxinia saemankumensis]SHI32465.1 Cytochrome c, mono-and diheme variants [Wenxinia saemankumensis]
MRALLALVLAGLLGVAAFWWISAPRPASAALYEGLDGDPARGERIFWAAGCAGCHTAPEAEPGDSPVLAGGQRFDTPFGTFVAPNISTDETHGIGAWSDLGLANAIQRGIGRDGAHLYPAFPYASYIRARPAEIVDLVAFLRTLPADATPSEANEVGFPFNIRRGLGLWKRLYLDPDPVVGGLTGAAEDGRHLVEALGHCGECHTPRTALGGPDLSRWMAGGPNPAGEGRIPGLTPGQLGWSEGDIAAFLQSGLTPDFDSVGGEMAEVIANTARLPDEDRAAIAAYLVALPDVETAVTAGE